MTQEQAIEIIKKNMPSDKSLPVYEALQTLIPELRESKYERIRKEIKDIVLSYRSNCVYEGNHHFDECLDWLEKQKDLDKMIVVSPEVWDKAINDAYENGKKDGEKQKEPHYTKRNALFDKCVENCDPEVMKKVSDEVDGMLEKEQKPAEWSDYKDKVNIPYCSSEPEWSDEDEKMRDLLIESLDDNSHYFPFKETKIKMIDWLKSLHPQPKQEWSEEDENMLNSCISSIEEAKENRYYYRETDGDTSYDHEISWLKSLRPSWKPSDQ